MSEEGLSTDMIGRRALSKEGHAAISMRGGDDRWIQIQKNTFTNWVNEQLRERDTYIEDLQYDFMDGTKLCYLVESLQFKRVKGKIVQNPQNQHQMLHNAGLALAAISEDNVKLVNIGPEDIVNSNLKLILGLIWHLVLRYQIGKTKFPPKKLMLAWLRAVIPECQIGNFTRDWSDGVALHALIDYCKPGLAPNWRHLNRNNRVENCRDAMQLAKQHFGIPLVLRPEDLSSPDLDELSGMTYLSYYMKHDSPGYWATLNWVRNAAPDANATNFTTDWNDGQTLCKLVRNLGGSCPPNPDGTPVENLQTGIDAAKRIGVDPILSAKEISEATDEHLGIMAYAASFNHMKPSRPPSEKVSLDADLKHVTVGNDKNFRLNVLDDKLASSDLRAEVVGPNTKVPVRLDWRGDHLDGHFVPKESGNHKLVIYCQDEVIASCPVNFNVLADRNRVVVHKDDKACLGVPTDIKVDTSSAGQSDIKIEAVAPSGRRFELPLSASRNGIFHSTFTPQEAGDWQITVLYEGAHVKGSPYSMKVYDPNAVKVYGLEGGAVGKALNFTADCSRAGEGELDVEVMHNGMKVPAKVIEEGHGIYKVDFVPQGAGVYKVKVTFNGSEVKGSPYTLEIVDSNLVTASGEGLSLVPVNKVAIFNVDTKAAGGGDVSVDIVAPSGKYLPVRVVNNAGNSFRVEYIPEEIGDHTVKVLYHGHPVKGNPFQVKVYDAGKVIVHKMPRTVPLGQPVNFEIDASEAGSGNLEIMVNGGRVPCQVENMGKRRFVASFVPESTENHVVEMKFNQITLAGSPWKVGVVDPRKVAVVNNSSSLKLVPMHKVVSFYIETDGIPSQELDVIVKAPSGQAVKSRLFQEGSGYRVEYTPTEVGTYTVQIFFAGSPVAGTPFTVKSYDSTSIQVSQVPNGHVGKPIDFFIDVTKAGEGQLEIMVNNGNLPNTVTQQRPGVYKVTFVPVEGGTHYVDIRFNGERLPGAPYSCQVIDASRVNVEVRRLVPVRESSHFVIQSQSVSGFDTSDLACVVEITSPSGRKLNVKLIGSLHQGNFRAEYMPMEIGTHIVQIDLGGMPVKGSPFQVKTYDASCVRVTDLPHQSIVGIPTKFEVDASDAGEGDLEIAVTNNGMNVPSQARSIGGGACEVSFVPREAGHHQIQVLYNKERVPGSPFVTNAYDTSRISASGEGLSNVLNHRPTHFNIHSGGREAGDVGVKVKGPDGRDLPVRVKETPDGYRVEWTPNTVGDHKVYVSYAEMQLRGSPFTPRVYDPSGVIVKHDGHGKISKPISLHLDAAKAGAGNLEIFVTSKGETVPNYVRQEGESKFEVTFTPQTAETHIVTINFNGDPVPGSPFPCQVVDSSRVHVSGDGLRLVPAHRQTSFKVDPQTTDPAECTVDIIAPSGRHIPARVTGGKGGAPYKVEYTPTETGQYEVKVKYDDIEVKGSPFSSDVYNPELVRVTRTNKAYLNKEVTYEVDTSEAGPGTLDVDMKCRGAVVRSNVREVGVGRYEVSFVPRDPASHTMALMYNGDTAGSPHHLDIIDSSHVTMLGEGLRTAQVYKDTHFEIDPHGPADEEARAIITGPSGVEIPCRISRRGNTYRVEYTPHEVGTHIIEALYAGMPIAGGPVTCQTFDPSQVRITDVDKTGKLEREIAFVVDASTAGPGEVEATVTHYGRMVRTWRENVGNNRHRYIFVPTEAGPYDVDVRFNNERTPGSPLLIQVEEDKPTTIKINFQGIVAHQAHKKSQFLLEMDGKKVDMEDVEILVRAPNGEQIPVRIISQSDGDYRVEWTPTIPGRYTIEVLFGGRKIQGSPFYVDVFDISRIKVENMHHGNVTETASFNVDFSHAGPAEHTIRVVGPSGHDVHVEVHEKQDGHHVMFEPHEPGRYKIYITYGGLEVPGSPFIVDIDEGRIPTARGDGLHRGEEDRPAEFYVDTNRLRGELAVQVDGPNSIAKCNIEQREGHHAVTYVPVEVGTYNVYIRWNGKEIPGSPFHPKVVDARKVKVVGGWQHYMDSHDRVQLVVDNEKQIPFDVSEAGPGQLTAEVQGPSGKVPCRVEDTGQYRKTVCFTPREEGDHQIYAYWSEHTLVKAPFHGFAVGRRQSPDHTKVILSGRGLREATVHSEAEFHIDGSEAGPGRPEVRLTGLKRDIPVRLSSLGGGKYRCTYIPEIAGAYLLNITWNDRQLRGSPFKLNVIHAHHPQKVVVSGEGLKGGIMGRDINVIIDTRKAGPGELTAHCMGPHRVAYCELEDMRDGTYRLNIRAQECGRHILQIKYGGDHVLGSPYVLRVAAQPDAGKVRVSGPGVENGLLAHYQSRFIVETRGAGAGQLTVRIRGPKGAFQVEMIRDSQKDRTILCQYYPCETGLYMIFVKWSGVDVPGSPFRVFIVDTMEELHRVMKGDVHGLHGGGGGGGGGGMLNRSTYNSEYSSWREGM